ncbi:MAG: capsular exopolysaccharide family [Actinomycetia bacterium]|nr:capsular exopolysaccharide family [Actinomycetes bacterium]
MMEVDSQLTENELRGYLGVLRRRKWWIIASVLATVGLAVFYSFQATKVYAATAQITVVDPAQSLVSGTGSSGSSTNADRYIATQLQIIPSQQVAGEVGRRLGPRSRLIRSVSAKQIAKTDVVSIRAESTSPSVARDAADTYAQVYVQRQRDQAASGLSENATELRSLAAKVDKQIQNAETKLGSLFPGPARDLAVTNVTSLTQSAQDLRGRADQFDVEAAFVRGGGSQIVAQPSLPSTPISPKPSRDVALAVVLGLLLGTGLAFGREYFDDAVHVEEVERKFPTVPILANIPVVDDWRDPARTRVVSLDQPHSAASEAYRSLRTSVEFAGLGQRFRRLLITSPSALEGKSTTVANLAVSLASAGSRVIIVDCDLRRPRQHDFFMLSNTCGLTSVLVERASLDEALQTVSRVAGGKLQLLASGPLPPNPSEVLRTTRFALLLDDLSKRADYVLIDSPPVLAVTDALVTSRCVDGTMCVARVRLTTNRRLAKALEQLNQSTTPSVGVVINSVTTGASSGAYYYYGEESRRGRRHKRFGRHGKRTGRRGKRTGSGYAATDWQEILTEKTTGNGGGPSEENGRKRGDQKAAGAVPPVDVRDQKD